MNIFSSFLLAIFLGIIGFGFSFADFTGCSYENGTYAKIGTIALDSSLCQSGSTWESFEITYPTSNADYFYNKGLMMGEKNNFPKAIEYLLKAQKEYSSDIITGSDKNGFVNILLDLSYFFIKNKQFEEALDITNKLLNLGLDYRPKSKAIALNNKGVACDNLGKHEKAKQYYQQALAIDYAFEIAKDNLDYLNELESALFWMYTKNMVAQKDIESFAPYKELQRQEAAKYLTDFAKKILKKVPNKSLKCTFSDLKKIKKTMLTFIKESCQLGLLNGIGGKFKPTHVVSNNEFITALGKLIYGEQKDYYSKAQEEYLFDKLVGDDYLKKDDALLKGDAAILLYRAYDTIMSSNDVK